MPPLLAILLLAFAFGADTSVVQAQETLHCRVSSVHDGDSMRVQCPGKRRSQRVRMSQIDAPELEQPYGEAARDFLLRLCRKGSTATIHSEGEDQYGRLLGNVYCNGKSVNEEMLRSGSAWVYNRHARDRKLHQFQNLARSQRRGLWAHKSPEPPWQWRYEQRQGE